MKEATIPELRTTGDAVKFSEVATPEQLDKVRKLREESLKRSGRLMGGKDFEAMSIEATRGQLFREVLEAKIYPKRFATYGPNKEA